MSQFVFNRSTVEYGMGWEWWGKMTKVIHRQQLRWDQKYLIYWSGEDNLMLSKQSLGSVRFCIAPHLIKPINNCDEHRSEIDGLTNWVSCFEALASFWCMCFSLIFMNCWRLDSGWPIDAHLQLVIQVFEYVGIWWGHHPNKSSLIRWVMTMWCGVIIHISVSIALNYYDAQFKSDGLLTARYSCSSGWFGEEKKNIWLNRGELRWRR